MERTNVRGLSARIDRGVEAGKEEEEEAEETLVAPTYSTAGIGLGLGMDVGALTAAMRPPDLAALTDGKSGGKKRRKGTSASGKAPDAPSEGAAKKKKKSKRDRAVLAGEAGTKPPMSAMDRAMAVLMGGSSK